MDVKRGTYISIFSALVLFLISSIVSAGSFDWFKRVWLEPESSKNVSVAVRGVDPVTVAIHNNTLIGINPLEGTFRFVQFNVTVSDPNGVNDINDASVHANFTFNGYGAVRRDALCDPISGEATATSRNYSCIIDMWYFDPYGTWTITAAANDSGNGSLQQNIKTFGYGQFQGLVISSETVQFPQLIPGDTNIGSINDPTSVNNTGNLNTSLELRGIHLLSDGPDPNAFLNVSGFNVSNLQGQECTSGVTLLNGTFVPVVTPLPRGNLSAGQGNITLYYCITNVPLSIPAQQYSTTRGGPWIIRPQ